ncbi:MAG: PSD1 domain-containing protein [Planctomycetaceae bacterium]|nr:PSD1 domain-containing protein [Planctomycetaceae bacterium]
MRDALRRSSSRRAEQRTATISTFSLLSLCLPTLLAIGSARANETPLEPAAVEFFETRIRPVLAEHCYACHSAAAGAPKGDFRLDSAEQLRRGGPSGPVIEPGKPADSTLISALKYESYEMPPSGKLPDNVIADFEQWIAMGAPDPRSDAATDTVPAAADPQSHWALQKPVKVAAPPVSDRAWPRSVIDAFILARLEAADLKPSAPADPATLLRRLHYDLTGLPPTAAELEQYAAHASDAEYEQAVDRLLASPQFGERWGRYWLDVARYADTKGYVFQEDRNYPTAYKYRDWVIAAFNGDMPFDEFVVNQIAADQTGDATAVAASGFLTLGRRFLNNPQEINDDRIDLMTRGLMGLTVACARCHDHKYDAIPTADYYSLYGILASCTETPRDDGPPQLVDAPQPVVQHVYLRGNGVAHGPEVTRHFLSCLTEGESQPFQNGSGRLELAQAIASRDNPLTARVWVNRVWGKLFGRGIVTTPSDFGVRGEPPTHPELLDWLAVTFMDEQWSTKRLIRRIVLSNVYRQSSAPRDDCHEADPTNALLAHMNRRRLDLEALRDSLLLAAGRLDMTMGGPSVQLTTPPFANRRAVYGFVERQNLPAFFRTFDFANPNTPAASRPQTASPHQALFMLNSPFALEQARLLAERSAAHAENAPPLADHERISQLYQLALGRKPSLEELTDAATFVVSGVESDQAAQPRWQFGWGVYNPLSDRVDFHQFPHFADGTWNGGDTFPDAELGWALLNVQGGHPGDAAHAVIRRFTAPAAGTLRIEGELRHPAAEGNGVVARAISTARGRIGEWPVAHGACSTVVEGIPVSAGDVIDLVVESGGEHTSDTFLWKATLRLTRDDGTVESWNTLDGIDGPRPATTPPLDRWSQLAQVLLMCNEFTFVD